MRQSTVEKTSAYISIKWQLHCKISYDTSNVNTEGKARFDINKYLFIKSDDRFIRRTLFIRIFWVFFTKLNLTHCLLLLMGFSYILLCNFLYYLNFFFYNKYVIFVKSIILLQSKKGLFSQVLYRQYSTLWALLALGYHQNTSVYTGTGGQQGSFSGYIHYMSCLRVKAQPKPGAERSWFL